MIENTFVNRVFWKLACAICVPLCLSVAVWRHAPQAVEPSRPPAAELPSHWDGQALRPLALSDVESRFARQFPGSIARMTTGSDVLVLRTVNEPTRMLHPAADCYRGIGWRVAQVRLMQRQGGALWRCFEAERGGQRLQVCEQITDPEGRTFTDTSAWYWAALLGQSHGPWQAVTVARPL